jgi:hypothetical protein
LDFESSTEIGTVLAVLINCAVQLNKNISFRKDILDLVDLAISLARECSSSNSDFLDLRDYVVQFSEYLRCNETWWTDNESTRWFEALSERTLDNPKRYDKKPRISNIQKLEEYYDANLLLANCLNSECYVSREVREEIEATMLLPVAEIEKWKAENGRN